MLAKPNALLSFLTLSLCLFAGHVYAGGGLLPFSSEVAEARKVAKLNKRPMVLYFYADW